MRTVVALIDKFLDFIHQRKSEATYQWYLKLCQAFAESINRSLDLSDLETHHIQEWIDSHKGWSDGTKHGAWRALNRCFRWGWRQGLLRSNPAMNVEKPSPPNREVVIADEHYRKMLELTKDDEFRDLITVAWECGPRPQELLAMEVRHVELQNGRMMFPRDEGHKGYRRVLRNTAGMSRAPWSTRTTSMPSSIGR